MTIRELLHSRAMLFETPADTGAGTPDPTPAATPAVATPPSPASPAPTSPWAGSPWAEKLDALPDGLSRQQVHELWQGEVQPYVTRKEQELGEAGAIWNALNDQEQSIPAFLALAERQYGPEVAEHLATSIGQYIESQGGSDPAPQDATGPDWESDEAYEQWYATQPPWVQAQEDQRRAGEEDATYQSEVQQYAPDVISDGTEHILARYVVASDGDVQQAKQMYDEEFGPVVAAAKNDPAFAAQVGLGHLHGQPGGAAPPEGAPQPPNVLGSTAVGGVTAPPTEQKYNSMDEVMDDFFEAVRGTGPHLQQQ